MDTDTEKGAQREGFQVELPPEVLDAIRESVNLLKTHSSAPEKDPEGSAPSIPQSKWKRGR